MSDGIAFSREENAATGHAIAFPGQETGSICDESAASCGGIAFSRDAIALAREENGIPREGIGPTREGDAATREGNAIPRDGIAFPREENGIPREGIGPTREGDAATGHGIAFSREEDAATGRAIASPNDGIAFSREEDAATGRAIASPNDGIAFPREEDAATGRAIAFPDDGIAFPREEDAATCDPIAFTREGIALPGEGDPATRRGIASPRVANLPTPHARSCDTARQPRLLWPSTMGARDGERLDEIAAGLAGRAQDRRMVLNIDLGELPDEAEALYAYAHLASVACGGHAGDDTTMRRAVALCLRHGTQAGAHPSYPDRQGFGRRRVSMDTAELRASVSEQCARLARIAAETGMAVPFVKAHGALYHAAREEGGTAAALVDGAIDALGRGITFVGPGAGELRAAVERAGLAFLREGFADRATRADGTLVPREEAGALRLDPLAAAAYARHLAASGEVDTLCVHGDSPGAVSIARAVREALDARPSGQG